MTDRDIPKMIRRLRTAFGLTQEQFAAKVGVTVSTINRWENDKGKPSPLATLRIEELQNELKQNK
ncbi:MAG: helix-turn-helix domain-containing protein [Planctomycetota bacterium]